MSVQITGDSPEAVAYALLEQIARAEGWDPVQANYPESRAPWHKSRAEILDAYRQCLETVQGQRSGS